MAALNDTPLWLIGLMILAGLIASVELGYRGNLRLRQQRGEPAEEQSGSDHLLSAVLGLLALLLGFTFSLALDRYEARREMVVEEANAIGTAWLRTQLLEEPARTEMSTLLQRYADARVAWSDDDVRAGMATTTQLQRQLWQIVGTAVRTDNSAQLSRAVMDAMNESFDVASARYAARTAHIPERVLHVLLLYAGLSMVMLGYILATSGRPHRIATTLLLLLLTLALTLILDIDRPRSGAIQVSQQPLIDVRQSMRSGRFDFSVSASATPKTGS